MELLDLDVAHIAVLGVGHHRHLHLPAGDLHLLVLVVPADGQGQHGALLPAHRGGHLVVVFRGDHRPFDLDDQVADLDAGLLRRRTGKDLDHLHIAGRIHHHRKADGGLLALIVGHALLVLLRGQILGVGVAQAADIALGHGVHQRLIVDLPVVVLPDIGVDLVELGIHDLALPEALHPAVEIEHRVAGGDDDGHRRRQRHQRDGHAERNFPVHIVTPACRLRKKAAARLARQVLS